MDSPGKQDPIRHLEAACRQRGVRLTAQRRRIFEALLGRTDHPTPDQVYASAKRVLPDVSRTTVYRVLEMLTALGLLTKACSRGTATRVDPRTQRHHHLVCRRCDRLFDVDEAAVDHRIRPPDVRRQGFAIDDYSIYFTGTCAPCQAKASASAPAGRRTGRPRRTRRAPKPRAPRS